MASVDERAVLADEATKVPLVSTGYNFVRKLGQGAFGFVINKRTKEKVGVKIKEFQHKDVEIAALQRVKGHPGRLHSIKRLSSRENIKFHIFSDSDRSLFWRGFVRQD